MKRINSAVVLHTKARALVQLLAEHGATLSTAESCTGGLIAKVMTDIPGSSAVFSGACVTYTNQAKMDLLGVSAELIERDTEVSLSCAEAMAAGARERLKTDYALSTTGFAGPGGGTDEDPVGTVYIGFATPHGSTSVRFCAPIGSDRAQVRCAAALYALKLLEKELES